MKKVLIVVDMQNDFVKGSLGTKEAQEIIPNIKRKIDEYLKNGDIVFFTCDTHYEDYFDTLEGQNLPVKHCIYETEGWEVVSELRKIDFLYCNNVRSIIKNTFGYIDWRKHLPYADESLEIELCGVCTDICVVSNALILRAIYPNATIFVDAYHCAGSTPEKHEAALEVMKSCQIEVIE